MKKSKRITLTGSVQGIFFEQFIKNNADKIGIRGYIRKLEDGRAEIFIEGDIDKVDEMTEICKRGARYSQIRHSEEKLEKFQGFKEFKIIRI